MALAVLVLPWRDAALRLLELAQRLGPAGAVGYAGLYALACVLMVPGSLLTLGAGFLYGTVGGILVVVPGSVAGATAAFLVARGFGREWVTTRLAASARLAAIDRAVERRGFRTVLLLRLSPVLPFNVLNYALGMTSVRLRDYVLASALGMLPASLLVVHAGSLVSSVSGLGQAAPPRGAALALLVAGAAALIAAVVALTRMARRELAAALEEEPRS